jgi:hypothetical protein
MFEAFAGAAVRTGSIEHDRSRRFRKSLAAQNAGIVSTSMDLSNSDVGLFYSPVSVAELRAGARPNENDVLNNLFGAKPKTLPNEGNLFLRFDCSQREKINFQRSDSTTYKSIPPYRKPPIPKPHATFQSRTGSYP